MPVTIIATPLKLVSSKDGFCILRCSTKDAEQLAGTNALSAKGVVFGDPNSLISQEVQFTGDLEKGEFGFTLSFSKYQLKGSEEYFWENLSGLSESILEQIYFVYGKNPVWLDNDEAEADLHGFKGITKKNATKVLEHWKRFSEVRDLIKFLGPLGLSLKLINEVHSKIGENAIKIITLDPYVITSVRGIGFGMADSFAKKLGFNESSPKRVGAGITFALKSALTKGHTYLPSNVLLKHINDLVLMKNGPCIHNEEGLRRVVDRFLKDKVVYKVVNNSICYALEAVYKTESFIYETFMGFRRIASQSVNNSSFPAVLDPSKAILSISQFNSTQKSKLCEEQSKALYEALTTPFAYAMTGNTGTGKSTVGYAFLKILEISCVYKRSQIVGCALKAAVARDFKRQSGYEGYTINLLLGFDGNNYRFNETHPLPYKIVCLEGAAMINSEIMYRLLKAIDFRQTKLLIIGDTGQLPPINYGQPFFDLIKLRLLPHFVLKDLLNLARNASIPIVAEFVRSGQTPTFNQNYSDIRFHKIQSFRQSERAYVNQEISQRVLDLVSRHRWKSSLPVTDEDLWRYFTHCQVITVRKTGVLGSDDLNRQIRARAIPDAGSQSVFRDFQPMTLFDKVIHLKHARMVPVGQNKEQDVAHGQFGLIVSVDLDNETVLVRYPVEHYSIRYDRYDLKNGLFGLAHAISIKHSQGIKFQRVILPLTMSHFSSLTKEVFYSGISRANNNLELVGEQRALDFLIGNSQSNERYTTLCDLEWQEHRRK